MKVKTEINDRIIKILEYGAQHADFSLEQLERDTGLKGTDINLYGTRPGGLLEKTRLSPGKYALKTEGLSMYMSIFSFREAQSQATKAHRMATWAIVITIICAIAALVVAFGWPWTRS